MLKSLLTMAFVMVTGYFVVAQQNATSVHVTDSISADPIAGALIQGIGVSFTSLTNPEGIATMSNANVTRIRVSFLGYKSKVFEISHQNGEPLSLKLPPNTLQTADVVVNGINTTDKSGLAYTNVSREILSKQNFGQDMPYLLSQTPSAVVTSDAGTGIGYSGIRIRGNDATRINVTLNGIPVNDAESQGLYWVNMPDLASSASTIQIQRGVGTSTNGAGAFGGSINVQTEGINTSPYIELNNSGGSFQTLKNTLRIGTGVVNQHFSADLRLSKISSAGFVDRATSDLKSFYASGNYFNAKTHVKLVVMSGKEKTYQSWNGIPADSFATNKTYNVFTYPNQTDNYQQDHYQLHVNHVINQNWTVGGAFFYTYGRGYYEEAQYTSDPYARTELATYGISPITLGNGTVLSNGDTLRKDSVLTKTDVIRRQWLDNRFYGGLFTLQYQKDNIKLVLGGGLSQYHGLHYGEVIWARYAGNTSINQRYYENSAVKNDGNIYAKLTWQFLPKANFFLDVQYREVQYKFQGENAKLVDKNQSVMLPMFNPKAGLNVNIDDEMSIFASVSMAQREPNRNDYVNALADNVPQKERMYDYELGIRSRSKRTFWAATGYFMDYQNQLVLTGELNEVGEQIRTNIGSSYRLGIELEGNVYVNKYLSWAGNLTLSRNRARDFNEIIFGYAGPTDYIRNVYNNTAIAYSPSVVGSSHVILRPFAALELSFITKYVGSQNLDNTGDDNKLLGRYCINDLRINYNLHLRHDQSITLGVLVNNIFNYDYVSNGYTFSDKNTDGSINTYKYYYPQAGRNFLLMLSIKI